MYQQYMMNPAIRIDGPAFILTGGPIEWYSIAVGAEIHESPDQVAEWTVSDFDILERVPPLE